MIPKSGDGVAGGLERPRVIVNVAISADGKLSTRERRQVKISGSADFSRVDRLKAECDAIMVGIGTVLADDPSLTIKSPTLIAGRIAGGREEHPVRVVVDSRARTPVSASVLTTGTGIRVIAVSSAADPERVRALGEKAVIIQAGDDKVSLPLLLNQLAVMGVRRLMVEGGGRLIWSLFEEDLVDEMSTFVGNMIIGGADAPTPADGTGFVLEDAFVRLKLEEVEHLDQGVLLRWSVLRT
jgi:2,5-diamino-6-(ribosylamino)-4(3H)-pyrimidinone 5'-phosphate reductase